MVPSCCIVHALFKGTAINHHSINNCQLPKHIFQITTIHSLWPSKTQRQRKLKCREPVLTQLEHESRVHESDARETLALSSTLSWYKRNQIINTSLTGLEMTSHSVTLAGLPYYRL